MTDVARANDPAALQRAAEIIRGGGVVAIPTETFYGLAVDWKSEAAVARIYEIKGRPATMQLPLVAASTEQVERELGALDAASAKAAARFWPGPLSLVCGAGEAVRVTAHPFVRALCECVGGLLTATSANRTGEPPAETADEVERAIGGLVDLIVDGGQTPGGKPSTLADLRGATPRLIRDGAIAWDEVLSALKT